MGSSPTPLGRASALRSASVLAVVFEAVLVAVLVLVGAPTPVVVVCAAGILLVSLRVCLIRTLGAEYASNGRSSQKLKTDRRPVAAQPCTRWTRWKVSDKVMAASGAIATFGTAACVAGTAGTALWACGGLLQRQARPSCEGSA